MDTKTFRLEGNQDQTIILVSAVRYAWGRSTYVPSCTCEILRKHIDELSPQAAYIIARDIRDYWCRDFDRERFGGESLARGTFYNCDVQPFVDLLPMLDEVSRPVLAESTPRMDAPQPPAGYESWEQVPDEVRYRWPTNID